MLVLVEPADSTKNVDIKPGFPLASLLGDGKLAMANPDSVPAGKYGKAALQKLGVWDRSRKRWRSAEDVRAALLFVSRKEAPLGIVYQTDAAADKGVKVGGVFPADTYPPIIYPVGDHRRHRRIRKRRSSSPIIAFGCGEAVLREARLQRPDEVARTALIIAQGCSDGIRLVDGELLRLRSQ